MNVTFLVAVGFLSTVFVLIAVFVIKLYFDERAARRRRDAFIAMTSGEEEARNPNERGGRRRRVAEEDHLARAMLAEDEDELLDEDNLPEYAENKSIGKKKLAKLQAKAEKKAQFEAERQERQERKLQEEEKRKQYEEERRLEELEEQKRKEQEKAEREERERRELEEYLKLKEAFDVEDQGFEALDEEQSNNLIRDCIEYIKNSKIVNIDELASHFKLRVEEAIERLRYFVDNEMLTGVIDDRGKFIYISPDELQSVAKFINQRGRVSVQELVDYSNKLIKLDST
uniref:DDRGK domain-containing protein 1 n=1 Tax=Acrobeloides nanus TaxID=290746 RepID=A0A914EIR3_9BILA